MCISEWSSDVCSSGPERARAPVAGHWSGPDEHDLGAALHHPLELLDGLLHDRQSDDRRGEDAVGVAELPGLVEPLVEGRSEARRVGKECVSTCGYRWWPYY